MKLVTPVILLITTRHLSHYLIAKLHNFRGPDLIPRRFDGASEGSPSIFYDRKEADLPGDNWLYVS